MSMLRRTQLFDGLLLHCSRATLQVRVNIDVMWFARFAWRCPNVLTRTWQVPNLIRLTIISGTSSDFRSVGRASATGPNVRGNIPETIEFATAHWCSYLSRRQSHD